MITDPVAARQAIAAALEAVLPGRVWPHPPPSKRIATPTIWIEDERIETTSGMYGATFPVWIVVDGAIQAQVAAAADLRWNAMLACAPLADDELVVEPAFLAGFRACVLNVPVVIAVETLCGLPAPQAVAIPPEPISTR